MAHRAGAGQDHLGDRRGALGLAEAVDERGGLAERVEGAVQVEPDVDRLLERLAARRAVGQGAQRLLEVRRGLAVGRAPGRLQAGLALMWMESVLGICMGCEIYGLLVRRGWATKDEAIEVCAHGACEVMPGQGPGTAQGTTKFGPMV